jgi:hypothetical protein
MGAATPTITPRQSEQRLVYCVLRVLRGLQHPPASPSTLQATGHDTVRIPGRAWAWAWTWVARGDWELVVAGGWWMLGGWVKGGLCIGGCVRCCC